MKTNSINAALAGGAGACAVNRASLAAAVAQLRGRSPIAFSDSQVEVDEEAGIIRNVAVMTIGPALGHGFDLDATSLEQLTALVNALPDGLGAKSRFTHPAEDKDGVPEDDLPTKVGRVRNLRIVGNCARGDVHLGSYASNLPGLGDVRTYLLKLAKEDPAQVGMSAVIAWEADPQMDGQGNVIANPARISEVAAIDFVGKPAANPDGLLAAKAALYSDDQPRDPDGKFASGGGGGPKGSPVSSGKGPITVRAPGNNAEAEAGRAQIGIHWHEADDAVKATSNLPDGHPDRVAAKTRFAEVEKARDAFSKIAQPIETEHQVDRIRQSDVAKGRIAKSSNEKIAVGDHVIVTGVVRGQATTGIVSQSRPAAQGGQEHLLISADTGKQINAAYHDSDLTPISSRPGKGFLAATNQDKKTNNQKPPASRPPAATLSTKGKRMDAELKKILLAAGVISDSDDDDAADKKYDGLSADDKAKYDGQCKSATSAKMAAMEKELTALKAKVAPATPATPATQIEPEDEFVALQAKRQNRINSLASNLVKTGDKTQEAAVRNAALKAIADNLTVEQAQTAILKAMGEALKPLQSVQVGDDKNVSSLLAAIPQALAMRWNPDKVTPEKLEAFEAKEKRDRPPVMGELRYGKLHERANELKHITLKDMMREYLSALGVDSQRMTDVQLARALGKRGFRAALGGKMASLAEGTSDFANITLDAINKSVRFFYLDAPKTWDKWAQRVTNPDFKNRNAIVLSESPTLLPRDEGGEIKYLVLSDGKEVYAVKEYIGGIKLTRQAIINDDKNIFTSIPRLLAMAASRLEDDLAYALLTNGTSSAAPYGMSDTFAVYDASHHSNYTSSGTAVSVASLQVGKTAMKKQKGLGGAARLELEPKFIIVPTSIEESVRQLLMSNILLAAQGTSGSIPVTVGASNPFANRYEIIGSTRLDDASATAWHLVTDYREGKINTAEICFLEDEPEPVIRQETDFDTEDVKFAERHTIAGKIIDYRGFYLNAGA